jgi:hypothetical protein
VFWIAFDLDKPAIFNVCEHSTSAMASGSSGPCGCSENLQILVIHQKSQLSETDRDLMVADFS